MLNLIKRILNIRIVRYALVGGIGIPIMDGALFVFMHLLGNRDIVLRSAPQLISFLISFSHIGTRNIFAAGSWQSVR
jgi:putative flippase GtrA